jgi:hypothetical protein
MNIRFDERDWDRLDRNWTAFWQGELTRPLVLLSCADPAAASVPHKREFLPQYGLQVSAEEIIAIETADLERKYFIGDSFPKFWLNFGPGSIAAYLGADVQVAEHTVWFQPLDTTLPEWSLSVDRGNVWFRRVHEILDTALRAWQGAVQVGFSDMGGNLDLVAALRGSQPLLLDLYDQPETVTAVAATITDIWKEVYREEARKIRAVCRGTTYWGPSWSHGTTVFLQSDFSYMISPAMFERFVLPDITALCAEVDDPFYHLDGKGALPHLDRLLSISALKGIQWQPGDGQPLADHWLPVLHKIRQAGKLCQVYVTPDGARRIIRELGGAGFIFDIIGQFKPDDGCAVFQELTQ